MRELRTILVPTDFSSSAEEAVRLGMDLARENGATLHLLHVVHCAEANDQREDRLLQQVQSSLLQADREARLALEKEEPLADHDVPVVKTLIRSAEPDAAIVEYADRKAVDLIVMPRQSCCSTGSCGPALLGSVAEGVIRGATCPVLVTGATRAAAPHLQASFSVR